MVMITTQQQQRKKDDDEDMNGKRSENMVEFVITLMSTLICIH